MDVEKLREERLALEKKLRNKGQSESMFVKELMTCYETRNIGDLSFKLKSIAAHKQAVISQQASDEELKKAEKVVKNLKAPYNEQKTGCDIKMRLVALIMQELDGFPEIEKTEED